MDDNRRSCVHDQAMLRLLPGPVHRLALRLAHGVRLRWWRASSKVVRGCNVIAANALGHVLLVRHSYHLTDLWMLPGGGLGKGESLLDAAARELAEEVGCTLVSPRHIDTVTLDRAGWTNVIEIVSGTTSDRPSPDGREIIEARFFAPDALPRSTSKPAQAMIARWQAFQNGSSL